jgi:L-threonylcarbamoyladenylate synthase
MTQKQIAEDIKTAVQTLRKGGLILYPTDTIWGIGCDASNEDAVRRIFQLKQREDSKAMICLVDNDNRLQRYVRNVPDVAWQLFDCAEDPTTIILDGAINLAPNLIAEDGSIAMRITREDFSKQLCYRFQKPIVSTSANISGEPSGTNLHEIKKHFEGSVDYFIDGGESELGISSTIVQVIDGKIQILRQGSITLEQLEKEI